MEYSDKWLGKLGGGLGASVVAGFSVCQAEVWSMAGGRVPMRVLITGKRLGLTANAEAGHYIVLVTGAGESLLDMTASLSGLRLLT